MEEKNSLRIRMKEKRKQYSKEEQLSDAEKIVKQLITIPEIHREQRLLLYSAKTPELSLDLFMKWCLDNQKEIYFPRVCGEEMDFFRIQSREDFRLGYFGILEPKEYCQIFSGQRAICLVPGVAFDKKGNRIGYGRGSYDRYFRRNQEKQMKKLGISYDFQLVDEIESEDFDEKLDGLVTPTGVMTF